MNQIESNQTSVNTPDILNVQTNIGLGYRLVQHCTSCGEQMEFLEGDMIYGGEWHHARCLKSIHNGGKNHA